jgi:Holliday junction DNA helicase RuvA
MVREMITFLEGTLVEALPTHVVVNVHGVGYHVHIPLSSYDKLPAVGAAIKILTHLAIREDAHVLYGFITPAERDLFRLLVAHVISGTTIGNFKAAVVAGDAGLLAKTKGIGKKTAERIIVELKDKVGIAAAWEAASASHAPTPEEAKVTDAVLGLIALGYKQVDAHKAVKQAYEKGGPSQTAEDLVRQALKILI